MSYASEIIEHGLEIRRRLGLWRPFEPVRWRRDPAPDPGPTLQERAALERRNTRRRAIIARIERQRGLYVPLRPAAAILAEVAAKHGLTLNEAKSHRRDRRIVNCRQEAAWRMTRETRLSLSQIGTVLGGFDHTSVIHAVRTYQKRKDVQE